MIDRSVGLKVVPALDYGPVSVFACSTGDVASGADINGVVIDRLGLQSTAGGPHLSQYDRMLNAAPFMVAYSSVGSTAANAKVTLKTRLQHGDSSGGGDMADLAKPSASDGSKSVDYGLAAYTTAHQNWSTGIRRFASAPNSYDLNMAKRFIRAVGTLTVPGNTTSTAAGSADLFKVYMGVVFNEGTFGPAAAHSTAASTST